jgi:hypothetical protein
MATTTAIATSKAAAPATLVTAMEPITQAAISATSNIHSIELLLGGLAITFASLVPA